MPISQVVKILDGKQFGFIKGLGKDPDYFFHRDDFNGNFENLRHEVRTNRGNVNVQFEVKDGEKGLRAMNVERV